MSRFIKWDFLEVFFSIESPELEVTQRDHQDQVLALHSPNNPTLSLRASSKLSLNSVLWLFYLQKLQLLK